jgi:hypothetical protein
MAKVRVVLDAMPAMMAAIVRDVALAVPGTIVAEAVAPENLVAAVVDLQPDVVVVGASTALLDDAGALDSLLCCGGRRVRVIALSSSGCDARVHDLRPNLTVLRDLSSQALLSAMRLDWPAHG